LEKQGLLLDKVADLVDAGKIRTTHSETLSPIKAANLRSFHAKLESGRTIGKITLSGW
jgi:NADPH:quinone reductase